MQPRRKHITSLFIYISHDRETEAYSGIGGGGGGGGRMDPWMYIVSWIVACGWQSMRSESGAQRAFPGIKRRHSLFNSILVPRAPLF